MLPKRTRSRWSAPLLAIAGLLIAAVVAAPVTARGGPPGNNGTIKIDRLEFDNHPNNEPHVGCIFEVDFYGFDEGNLWADVVFEAHPPTGRGVLLTDPDRVFIGHDDNSGGGSEAGWDASADYDLSAALGSYPAHANQGHHVKLTIHADGSQGADTKHKVFWVEGCSPPTTPTTPPGGIAPGGGGSRPPGSGTQGGNPPVGMLPDTAVSSDYRAAKLLAALALIGASATLAAVRVRQRSGRE